MQVLFKLQKYLTGRKAFLPTALLVSALSALLSMAPLALIWLIVRELFGAPSPGEASKELIANYGWWALAAAVGSLFLYLLGLMLSHLAAFRAETEIRRQSMKRLVALPLGFFDANSSGRIRKIIDDNASTTHIFLAHQLPDLAGSVIAPLSAFVLLFVFDWRMGIACLIPILLAMLFISKMMGEKGRKFMTTYMNALEEMSHEAVEYVRGIPIVKVFQQTIYSFKSFHKSIVRYQKMATQYTAEWKVLMSIYTALINGFAYFLVPAAILIIGRGEEMKAVMVDLFFYLLLTPLFAQFLMRSMNLNQAVMTAGEAVNRIEELFAAPPLPQPEMPQTPADNAIEYRQVSFTYAGAERPAVDGVSFTLPQGQTFSLVGASGGGKTTIARLLPRFWDAVSGEVSVGGAGVKQIDQHELMRRVSFVFQNSRLFKTTLIENIRYGNENASLDEVKRAAELARCGEFLARLPKGLDTRIGTEGTWLSGGEQQRVALARAILKDAPIIVLDEATAFADPENEHLIQAALAELTKGKTVLMIAHRLSSVVGADAILVIDKGKIVERGTHAKLLERQGTYYTMWNEYQKAAHWSVGGEADHD